MDLAGLDGPARHHGGGVPCCVGAARPEVGDASPKDDPCGTTSPMSGRKSLVALAAVAL